jgi:hypothetical protein
VDLRISPEAYAKSRVSFKKTGEREIDPETTNPAGEDQRGSGD